MEKQFTIEIISAAKAAKATYDGERSDLDRGIADYVNPKNSAINCLKTPHTENYTDGIFDTTVIHAQQTFSAGCYEYMLSGEWFDFGAPASKKKSEIADDWYRECAEIIRDLLNESNFSLKIQEHMNDRNSFGYGEICLEAGKNNFYNFRVSSVGSVYFTEDDEGMVDSRYVRNDWTAGKIVGKFGEENVSEEVQQAYHDVQQRHKKTFIVWNIIKPREDAKRQHGKIDGPNKPWMSYWCEENAQHELENGGFDERPFVCSRFAQWTSEYGWSPAILILPTVRSIQAMERDLQALSELKVWPRTLIPEGFRDIIDWSLGGTTVYSPQAEGAKPEVWGDGGDYSVGVDMIERKIQVVKDAYHVDLFKALAERTKTMTATEVLELVEEKLINFRPTFARFTSETLDPLLRRAFNMALRAGKLPDVPQEVLEISESGEASIPTPKPVHVSKIARALRALENRSLLEFLQQAGMLIELTQDPRVLTQNYDMDRVIRKLGDNHSLDSALKIPQTQRDEVRAAEAQQAAAQAQLAAAESATKSAANMGKAPQEMQESLGQQLGV